MYHQSYYQDSCNTSINQRKMSRDLANEDFDENPTTVSGSGLMPKTRLGIDTRSHYQDESYSTELPSHAVQYEKELKNHGEQIIRDLNMDNFLGPDEEDRRKNATPRHHSQGTKKEDHIYRNQNFTSKKEPVMWPDHYSNQVTPYKPKY